MSCSLDSRGLYKGLLQGLFRGILGVEAIAHIHPVCGARFGDEHTSSLRG